MGIILLFFSLGINDILFGNKPYSLFGFRINRQILRHNPAILTHIMQKHYRYQPVILKSKSQCVAGHQKRMIDVWHPITALSHLTGVFFPHIRQYF